MKRKKTKVISRYFNYLVIRCGTTLHIRRRGEGDIWALLYEFPYIETSRPVKTQELINNPDLNKLFRNVDFIFRVENPIFRNVDFTIHSVSKEYHHQLTHQHIFARFLEIESQKEIQRDSIIPVRPDQLENYAMPRLLEKYLQDIVN